MGARQCLQRPAALDEDAAPGGLRHAGDEGDRCRQDQRAGCCRHQHGEAAKQIARDQPGNERERQGDRQEDQRITVGQPHERRLGGLRRGRQPHDAGIGALARESGHQHLKCLAGIQRAGKDGGAARPGDRNRFAGERRFVDRRSVRVDDTVDRHDLARVHQQPVADGDSGYRHLLDPALGQAMRLARRAVDQCAQITLGAGNRDILEHIAAGIHQRHDGAGQRLPERYRSTHRHQRDRIDAEPPGQQVARNGNGQSRDHG